MSGRPFLIWASVTLQAPVVAALGFGALVLSYLAEAFAGDPGNGTTFSAFAAEAIALLAVAIAGLVGTFRGDRWGLLAAAATQVLLLVGVLVWVGRPFQIGGLILVGVSLALLLAPAARAWRRFA